MQDKIMNGLAVSQQIIEPLAPNRPLTPITWKSAPKDPHGYYDRNNYARGWNDAVATMQKTACVTIMGENTVDERIKSLMANIGFPDNTSIYQAMKQLQHEIEAGIKLTFNSEQ